MSKSKEKKRWTLEELKACYEMPFFQLLERASECHRAHHDPQVIQLSALLSVKTGGCSEDCSYCPQSGRYTTEVKATPITPLQEVIAWANQAAKRGASRICLGAAWREVREGRAFDRIVEMVEAIASMNLEVCCTLGMVSAQHLYRLQKAGLFAYNHNLDSSESFYNTIITTRSYASRLETLARVAGRGISLCTGAIIGMGESLEDRLQWVLTLTSLDKEPDSIPINQLVPFAGTPMEGRKPVLSFDVIRLIALVRIVFPRSVVRLSAGRFSMNREAQALCFLAGTNSIFIGDRLLASPNPSFDQDEELLSLLNMRKK